MHRSDDPTSLGETGMALDDVHLTALEDYWRSIADASTIPARTDLDPSKIEQVLPSAFILQRVAQGTARFRVAGQRIHDLLKLDPRGMPFSTLFDQDEHYNLRNLVEGAFSDPAIVGLPLLSHGNMLRPALSGAMLLLPMRDGTGATTRLLGALITPAHHTLKPRRFTIRSDSRNRYERLGALKPKLVSFMPKPAPKAKRPDTMTRTALKLVVSNG